MGITNLFEIFKEKYYENLEGCILESFGRLFRNSVKLYVYPMRKDVFNHFMTTGHTNPTLPSSGNPQSETSDDVLITAKTVHIKPHLHHLYDHLMQNHYIECIEDYDSSVLHIFSEDVLHRIQIRDDSWEAMVPESVMQAIKSRHLFDYEPPTMASP